MLLVVEITALQCDQIGRFIALLGNFSKPVATIIFAQISHIFRHFLYNSQIFHFAKEIIFGQLL